MTPEQYAAVTGVEFFLAQTGLGMFKRRCTGGNCYAWEYTNARSGLELSFVNDDAFAEADDPYWQLCVRGVGDHDFTESEHETLDVLSAWAIGLCLQVDQPQSLAAKTATAERVARAEAATRYAATNALTLVFAAWTEANGFTPDDGDAMDLLHHDRTKPEHFNWLHAFITVWDAAQKIEDEAARSSKS